MITPIVTFSLVKRVRILFMRNKFIYPVLDNILKRIIILYYSEGFTFY
jgi:hypothetical protein